MAATSTWYPPPFSIFSTKLCPCFLSQQGPTWLRRWKCLTQSCPTLIPSWPLDGPSMMHQECGLSFKLSGSPMSVSFLGTRTTQRRLKERWGLGARGLDAMRPLPRLIARNRPALRMETENQTRSAREMDCKWHCVQHWVPRMPPWARAPGWICMPAARRLIAINTLKPNHVWNSTEWTCRQKHWTCSLKQQAGPKQHSGSSRPLLPVFTSLLRIITPLLHHYDSLLHHYNALLRYYCVINTHYYVIIVLLLRHLYTLLHHYYIIITSLLHQYYTDYYVIITYYYRNNESIITYYYRNNETIITYYY